MESDFWERARGISQKSYQIIAKIMFFKVKFDFCEKILQTFLQCPPLHPHGVGGSNPVFSEIGNFWNFLLYIPKIVFFNHTLF
jgi:hypothetical protein